MGLIFVSLTTILIIIINMECAVSHKHLYFSSKLDVFTQLTSHTDVAHHLVMHNETSSAICASQSINEYTLVEEILKPDAIVSQFILTTKCFNSDLITQLIAIVAQPCWLLSVINTCLDVSSIKIELSETLTTKQHKTLITLCENNKIDINDVIGKPTLQAPGLVVLDMDSTSITIECIDEIAKLANVGEQVAEITELAMQGKLDFSQSLISRVGKLKGIELSLLDSIANNLPLMEGMAELVKQFKKNNWKVAIASGGFTYFADNLKELLSLDDAVSNTLTIADGKLTGEVEGQIVDAQVKADTVKALATKYNIDMNQTIAIGDGANDLKMMEMASLGIAFHAKPLVQKQADLAINFGSLTSVIALLTHP